MRVSFSNLLLSLAVSCVSMLFIGCDEECIETDAGGVCVDYYGDAYYYDSLVSGVTYENLDEEGAVMRTSVTGEGGDPGRFLFLEGQSVRFSLGDTVLGEAAAKERITPFDLTGIDEEAVGGCEVDGELPEDTEPFREVAHLAVLLQTLDTDGDSSAGIEISSDVAALFDGVNIEVDQLWTDFKEDLQAVLEDARSGGLLPDDRDILEREDALKALYQGIGLCE